MSCAAALTVAASLSLQAHHNHTAEYDASSPVQLVGRIAKVEWINPHSFLEVQCPTPAGKVESWRVEVGSPSSLSQEQISREMLAIGTEVTINGFRAKNGSTRAWGLNVTFANGDIRRLDDTPPAGDPVTEAPPSLFARLMSSQPFLPYLLAGLPVAVLLVGLFLLRRPRRDTRSVPK